MSTNIGHVCALKKALFTQKSQHKTTPSEQQKKLDEMNVIKDIRVWGNDLVHKFWGLINGSLQ